MSCRDLLFSALVSRRQFVREVPRRWIRSGGLEVVDMAETKRERIERRPYMLPVCTYKKKAKKQRNGEWLSIFGGKGLEEIHMWCRREFTMRSRS